MVLGGSGVVLGCGFGWALRGFGWFWGVVLGGLCVVLAESCVVLVCGFGWALRGFGVWFWVGPAWFWVVRK